MVSLAPAIRNNTTPSYLGSLHPRLKPPLGWRLAQSFMGLFMGGSAPYTGPTIAGCAVDNASSTLTVFYNVSLLRGETVLVQPFDASLSAWGTSDSSTFMVCFSATGGTDCLSDDEAHLDLWVPASALAGLDGSSTVLTIPPLPSSGGVLSALRYGWTLSNAGDTCCPHLNVTRGYEVCIPGNCPIKTSRTFLPGNPFYANITAAGKCACLRPQQCDLPNASSTASASETPSLSPTPSRTQSPSSSQTASQAGSVLVSVSPSQTLSPSRSVTVAPPVTLTQTLAASQSTNVLPSLTQSSSQSMQVPTTPSSSQTYSIRAVTLSSTQSVSLEVLTTASAAASGTPETATRAPSPTTTRSQTASLTSIIAPCATSCTSAAATLAARSDGSSAAMAVDVSGVPFKAGVGTGVAVFVCLCAAGLLLLLRRYYQLKARAGLGASDDALAAPSETVNCLRTHRVAPSPDAPAEATTSVSPHPLGSSLPVAA